MTEKVYYDKGNVQVTNSRAIMDNKTFAMSNITSVSMKTIPPKSGCIIFPTIILVVMLIGLSGSRSPVASAGSEGSILPVIIIALVVIGIAVVLVMRLKPSYVIQIGSASGEVKGMTSQNRAEIEEIVDAMNQAIVERG